MVTKCYVELRKPAARGTDSIIADVMRHLNTRQHLGKAVIVCEQPLVVLSVARKQWVKLTRVLQKQRSSTLNADKILKYTHAITRMQRMHFTLKGPDEQPAGDVYFLQPDEVMSMPANCWTVYNLAHIPDNLALALLHALPAEALVVEYDDDSGLERLDLQPKKVLEARVTDAWSQAAAFLKAYQIDVAKLVVSGVHDSEAMDDALDILLSGYAHKFLQVAGEFQRALELARPLRLKKETRASYDAFALLAHRVQALSPGAFSQHFLETYNEDDTFFLYDSARSGANLITGSESLSEASARHARAGRTHLARSIQHLAEADHNTKP